MHVRAVRRVPLLLAAVAALAALTQQGAGRAESTHGITVAGSGTQQSPYVYQGVPASITVGDTLTWLNPTTVNHTITPTTSPDPNFRSQDLRGQGSYYQYRFTVAGSYAFRCDIHPATMHATFTVNPPPPPTPTPRPSPPATPPAPAAPAAAPAPRPAPTATPTPRRATPAATATAAPSPPAAPAPAAAATAPAVAGVESPSATTSGGTLPTAPTPPLTAAPADTGGPGLPVVLALLAVVLALAGGALGLRRRA